MDDFNSPNYHAARELARNLIKLSGVKTLPVLLKQIAPYIPDLEVKGMELVDELSGMQISYKGKEFVRFNSNQSKTRSRFTVAHEIGHVVLGHTVQGVGLFSASPEQEKEAFCFAAELLMPLSFMKKAVEKNTKVSELARVFWVSKEAMTKRVMETGLFRKIRSFE